jgi:hypothetical protein
MKYGYREIRKINADEIRGLCIKHDWFTRGNNAEYDVLLQYGFQGKEITTDELVEMAKIILEHSDTDYELTSVMHELSQICYTYFEEV